MASASLAGAGQRWRRWVGASDNRKIFGALLVVGMATVGVKLASMFKDFFVAAAFGTNRDLDAYFIAFVLPYFATNLLAGAINSALIPVFIEVREKQGIAEALRLLSGVLVACIGVLGAATLALAVVGPLVIPWLATGFDDETLALCRRLFYVMLPTVLISGIASVGIGVLLARERFALASISEIAVPICSAVALLFAKESWGIYALATGLAVGVTVQLGLVGRQLKQHGLLPRLAWHGMHPALRQVIAQWLPMVGGTLLISTAPLIDQAMAATLTEGSVATLNFGNKIVSPLLAVSAMALGSAVIPYFSQMVTAANWSGLRRTLFVYSRLILLVSIPLTLLLIVFSKPLIGLLFERGEFDAASTARVARVNAMYALQIPAYAVVILFVRLISALQANKVLMYGSAIGAVLNVGLDIALTKVMGVEGIALATAIVYTTTLVFLGTMLFRILRQREAACA